MKITESEQAFMDAALDTPFGAVCVKKRGKNLRDLFDDNYGHGVLVDPPIGCNPCRGATSQDEANEILYRAILDRFLSDRAMVTVRGHGWDFEKRFVWTGTVKEFKQTWVID